MAVMKRALLGSSMCDMIQSALHAQQHFKLFFKIVNAHFGSLVYYFVTVVIAHPLILCPHLQETLPTVQLRCLLLSEQLPRQRSPLTQTQKTSM